MQCLKDPNQSNLDNIYHGRCELADISGPNEVIYEN